MTAAAATIAFRPAKIGGDEAVRREGHESQTPLHVDKHDMEQGNDPTQSVPNSARRGRRHDGH